MGLKRAIAIAILAASPVRADFDPTAYPPYETCALCHGLFGVSHSGKFPNLAGQQPDYIRAQIAAFLSGDRHNDGGQMAAIVTELAPEAIPIVVDWFATQDPPTAYDAPQTSTGADSYASLGCAACHANTPQQAGDVPYLSAQHASYLAKQMRDFRDGARSGLPVHGLHATLLAVPDAELDAIATYLAAEDRP